MTENENLVNQVEDTTVSATNNELTPSEEIKSEPETTTTEPVQMTKESIADDTATDKMTPAEQEAYKNASKQNFETINNELKVLGTYDIATLPSFNDFWDKAKIVGELFKKLRPLSKEDREMLWLAFDYHCEKAKKIQESRKELRIQLSEYKKDIILAKIAEAKQIAVSDSYKAIEVLKVAMDWMKESWGDYAFPTDKITEGIQGADGKLRKEDNDLCWIQWKDTREMVNQLIQDANHDNYLTFKIELNPIAIETVDGNPFEAVKAIKDLQIKLKKTPMNQSEWKELNDALQLYWEKANKRIDEDKEKRKADQERKEIVNATRNQERKEKLEINIVKFKELIAKNESVIARINEQVDKLKVEIENARSDEYRAKVQSWIDEKQARINSMLKANKEIEEKLSDMTQKLHNS